jgi:thiol-disulfide isomerase/thioredoxin
VFPERSGKTRREDRTYDYFDHRGKVVVLVFWGMWCGPGMREVPHERELAEAIIGPVLDRSVDDLVKEPERAAAAKRGG